MKLPHSHIILLNSSFINNIGNNLNKLYLVKLSVIYFTQILDTISDAGVYYIPCKDCKLKYILAKRREMFRNVYMNMEEISV